MNFKSNFGNEDERNPDNFLNELPNDQYVCPKCKKVPEIIGVDYEKDYSISLKCEEHGNMTKSIKNILKKNQIIYI